MKEYQISIKEILERTVPVKAKSYEEAVEKVRESYRNSDIVLDANDFKDVSFGSPEGVWLQ